MTAEPNGHARFRLVIHVDGHIVQYATFPLAELERLVGEETEAKGAVAAGVQLRSEGDIVHVRFAKVPEGFIACQADRDGFAELVRSLKAHP